MLIFKKRLWRDRVQTLRLYYKSPKFALIDLLFGFFALFSNPYRTCRKFLQKKGGREIHAYGETPFTSYQRIVEQCGIGPQDTWMEMGAGRGKGCFWLAHFVGCKVIGVEWIPQFVFVANWIRKIVRMKRVVFECKEMEKADASRATVFYLYGHFPSIEIPAGTKVIAISEPFGGIPIVKTFWVRYPWGRTTAFLQTK